MKKIKLVAPAGDIEKLKFSVLYGADAVYFSGRDYGLRAGAGNFDLDQMAEALKYYDSAAGKSRSETGARATFMIGEAHFAAKKYADAVRRFQRVMYGYGGEKAPADVKREPRLSTVISTTTSTLSLNMPTV